MRLAVVTSHPVQYYAPLFRALAQQLELTVLYGYRAGADDQAAAGFGVGFAWDSDLMSGYASEFLDNRAAKPGLDHFAGIDTPAIGRRLRAGGFGAVLLIGWHKKFLLQALYAAKRLRLPVLVRGDSHLETPRSLLKQLAKRLVYPAFLRQFDAALIVGQRNREYWAHYGYPAARMFASPHCVDNAWFAQRAGPAARAELRGRLGIAAAAPVALFAGKLIAFKHPEHLIEAAALVRARGIPLEVLIAGDGPLRQSIDRRAGQLAVPLHQLGFCNQSQMPAAYAAADVLVLPSDGCETWGLVTNEALSAGTPVLVADTAGCARDMVAVLGAAAAYPFADTAALADRIAAQLALPSGAAVVQKAADSFAISAAVAGIVTAAEACAFSCKPR